MHDAALSVHIVDDDESFLKAISRLLSASGLPVRCFSSSAAFLASLTPELCGCAVIDLRMPETDGLELQQAIRASGAILPVIFLTGQGDIASSVRAMRCGAEDFLEKTAPRGQLLDAIGRALERAAKECRSRARSDELRGRFALLTPRECEVLQHVVRGQLNKQIAADLQIHERTVKLHRTSITEKLQVQSVAELTRLYQEAGYFDMAAATFPKGQ
jgi:FixJ family two-component response regulator